MIGLAVLLSADRRRIDWRLVGMGLALQAVFGVIVLKTAVGQAFFDTVGRAVTGLLRFQEAGARFVRADSAPTWVYRLGHGGNKSLAGRAEAVA